jgi:hypothetical protein
MMGIIDQRIVVGRRPNNKQIIGGAMKRPSLKQQRLNAELGLIVDEMGRAMWNANKEYIATSIRAHPMTISMMMALDKFKSFCEEHYGQKA